MGVPVRDSLGYLLETYHIAPHGGHIGPLSEIVGNCRGDCEELSSKYLNYRCAISIKNGT